METNHELVTNVQLFLQDRVSGVASDELSSEAWRDFFAVYDQIVRRFAIANGISHADVDECSQEVWATILEHLDSFEVDEKKGRFRTWLYTVVRSKAVDMLRRSQRASALSLNDSRRQLDVVESESVDLGDELDESWRRVTLKALLRRLRDEVSADAFALFHGRAVKGKSYEEIGQEMGLAPGTVRTKFHRTLQTFRRLCRRYAFDDFV